MPRRLTFICLAVAVLVAGCALTPEGQCEAAGLSAGTPEFTQCLRAADQAPAPPDPAEPEPRPLGPRRLLSGAEKFRTLGIGTALGGGLGTWLALARRCG